MLQFVLLQFIVALAYVLNYLLTAYWWIVIISVLISWVNADPRNPIVRFFYSATEPVLYHIRRRLPFVFVGGFDLSPIVLIIGIEVVRIIVVSSLGELARQISMQASLWHYVA